LPGFGNTLGQVVSSNEDAVLLNVLGMLSLGLHRTTLDTSLKPAGLQLMGVCKSLLPSPLLVPHTLIMQTKTSLTIMVDPIGHEVGDDD
jgi:hypothetical protein